MHLQALTGTHLTLVCHRPHLPAALHQARGRPTTASPPTSRQPAATTTARLSPHPHLRTRPPGRPVGGSPCPHWAATSPTTAPPLCPSRARRPRSSGGTARRPCLSPHTRPNRSPTGCTRRPHILASPSPLHCSPAHPSSNSPPPPPRPRRRRGHARPARPRPLPRRLRRLPRPALGRRLPEGRAAPPGPCTAWTRNCSPRQATVGACCAWRTRAGCARPSRPQPAAKPRSAVWSGTGASGRKPSEGLFPDEGPHLVVDQRSGVERVRLVGEIPQLRRVCLARCPIVSGR